MEGQLIVDGINQHITRMSSPWRTTSEAALYCRVSEGTIRRLADQGVLPQHRFGDKDHPLYHIDEIDAALGYIAIKRDRRLAA